MSKREATDQLERNYEDIPENPSILKTATEEEIKNRKIYTIKRPNQQETQPTKTTAEFLFQKADIAASNINKEEKVNINKEQNNEKTLFELKQPSTTQMFSGSISIDKDNVNTNLFFNNVKAELSKEEKVESTAVNSQDNVNNNHVNSNS